jgi:hypothetical protein
VYPSAVEFWKAYQDPKGGNMGYQALLDALKSKREASHAPDAAAARKFFAGDLGRTEANGAFTYKKGVYRKDKDIAVRWRKLLETDEGIRTRWEAMQSASDEMSD